MCERGNKFLFFFSFFSKVLLIFSKNSHELRSELSKKLLEECKKSQNAQITQKTLQQSANSDENVLIQEEMRRQNEDVSLFSLSKNFCLNIEKKIFCSDAKRSRSHENC